MNNILIPITPDLLLSSETAIGKEITLINGDKLERIDFDKLAAEVGAEANDFEMLEINLQSESPEKKGFYFPTEAGIYANYGNIEVTTEQLEQLVLIILFDGVTFSLIEKSIPALGVVEEGNSQAVSGGEVFNALEEAFLEENDITPQMTNGKYISLTGLYADTTGDISANGDFINIEGYEILEYYGSVGVASTRIAFYNRGSQLPDALVDVFPEVNEEAEYLRIKIPPTAKYARFTCFNDAIDEFKVIAHSRKEFYKEILNDFTIYGTPTYDANNIITTANIVWNDGSKGVVTYNTWNEQEFTYTGFVATSIERGISVNQSPVTFDSNGKITNYPILTYTIL